MKSDENNHSESRANNNGWRRYDADMKFYDKLLSDVMDDAATFGVSNGQLGRLELGVEEVVTNIINYAYDEPGYIWVKTSVNGNFFRLDFVDHGKYFDPLAKDRRPTKGIPTIMQAPGGYGIFLVKKNFSSVTYNYEDLFGKMANHLSMELAMSC